MVEERKQDDRREDRARELEAERESLERELGEEPGVKLLMSGDANEALARYQQAKQKLAETEES